MLLALLLSTGPLEHERWETASGLAGAALDRGHEVVVFLLGNATLHATLAAPSTTASPPGPAPSMSALLARGARVFACGTAADARGLSADNCDPRIRVGGLPDLALLLACVDRLVKL